MIVDGALYAQSGVGRAELAVAAIRVDDAFAARSGDTSARSRARRVVFTFVTDTVCHVAKRTLGWTVRIFAAFNAFIQKVAAGLSGGWAVGVGDASLAGSISVSIANAVVAMRVGEAFETDLLSRVAHERRAIIV